MGRVSAIAVALALLAGCQTTPDAPTTPAPSGQPAPPPPNASHVPAGTVIVARLNDDLNATAVRLGDTFTLTVPEALLATNQDTVIPAGSLITGMVTGVSATTDPPVVRLNFTRIGIEGASHPFTARITATSVAAEHRAAEDVAETALGAVLEGDLRNTLTTKLGAGAGTLVSLGRGGMALPVGTQLTLQTVDRIDLSPR